MRSAKHICRYARLLWQQQLECSPKPHVAVTDNVSASMMAGQQGQGQPRLAIQLKCGNVEFSDRASSDKAYLLALDAVLDVHKLAEHCKEVVNQCAQRDRQCT